MKSTLLALIVTLSATSVSAAGEITLQRSAALNPPEKTIQANCELRLVQPSEAGSVYLSTFASDEKSCLKLGDEKTRAQYRGISRSLAPRNFGPKAE
jgi:hypothetical protein